MQSYIDELTKKKGAIKVGRLLAKSINADAKLTRFLQSKPDQGLSFFTDKAKRDGILDKIAEGYGLTSVKRKQAMSIKMIQEDVDVTIEQLRLDVTAKDTLVLDDRQKGALTAKLIEIRKFIIDKLHPAAMEVANELGVLEDVKEEQEVLAQA